MALDGVEVWAGYDGRVEGFEGGYGAGWVVLGDCKGFQLVTCSREAAGRK